MSVPPFGQGQYKGLHEKTEGGCMTQPPVFLSVHTMSFDDEEEPWIPQVGEVIFNASDGRVSHWAAIGLDPTH